MNSNIISSEDMISAISDMTMKSSNDIFGIWKRTVNKIKSKNDNAEITLGEKMANNSRVIDMKHGTLLIEVNHSGWIQYFNMYKKFILNGINMNSPEYKIDSLVFRVRGSNFQLMDNYEENFNKEREKMEQKRKELEEKAEKLYGEEIPDKKDKLPEDLFLKLESLKTE